MTFLLFSDTEIKLNYSGMENTLNIAEQVKNFDTQKEPGDHQLVNDRELISTSSILSYIYRAVLWP